MVEVKQVSRSAASKKKKTARKKTATARKTAAKGAKKKATTAKKTAAKKTVARKARRNALTPEQRYRLVAEAAFLKAEQRGFVGGDPVQDWLEAEREVESSLTD